MIWLTDSLVQANGPTVHGPVAGYCHNILSIYNNILSIYNNTLSVYNNTLSIYNNNMPSTIYSHIYNILSYQLRSPSQSDYRTVYP